MQKELIPYAYTPYTVPLTRHTLPNGTIEYRSTSTGNPVEVDTEDLFDLISYSHEQIFTLVEMLPEDIYSKYAYIFKGLIQNISATLAETRHFVQDAGVQIDVTTIYKSHFLCREGAVVDAVVKGVNHAD